MKATAMAVPTRALVRDALVHLKKLNGASFAQLRKHLEANHAGKLDAGNRKMLSSALRGLVQSGSVERKGKMYKLGGAIPITKAAKADLEDAEVPGRRRRRLPVGYCKTHRFRHKAGRRRRRRRSHRRRRRSHRRRRHSHRRRRHHRRKHSRRRRR